MVVVAGGVSDAVVVAGGVSDAEVCLFLFLQRRSRSTRHKWSHGKNCINEYHFCHCVFIWNKVNADILLTLHIPCLLLSAENEASQCSGHAHQCHQSCTSESSLTCILCSCLFSCNLKYLFFAGKWQPPQTFLYGLWLIYLLDTSHSVLCTPSNSFKNIL